MTTNRGTYYKALLLLVAFSVNTLVSFACSLSSYVHGLHHDSPVSAHTSSHHQKSGHEHNDIADHQHHHEKDQEKTADDCCSTSVVEVQRADKSVSRSIEAPPTVFLVSFIHTFAEGIASADVISSGPADTNDRWRPLSTIPDLRIIIQSFQI